MFKPKSIYQQVVYNTLFSACIPLVIISIIFCCFVYNRNEKSLYDEAQNVAREYASSIQAKIEDVHQKSDYILKSDYISKQLDTEFSQNTAKLLLSDYLAEYIGLFDTGSSGETVFTIYTSNRTVYEDKYVTRMEKLENADLIQKQLENNLTNLVWEEDVRQDARKNGYFVFYRKFMTEKTSILACRVYIPENTENCNVRILADNDEKEGSDERIVIPINEHYSVQVLRDSKAAQQEVLKIIMIFVAIMVFALMLTYFVAKQSAAKYTRSTTSFVKELNNQNLLELDEDSFYQEEELEEMQIIKKAILQLLSEIKKITRQKQRIELEKKDIEFSLLQKQLDPHTLYNSLSVIKYNAFVRNDTETIDIVNHMTDYYRAVLNKGKDFVKLKDELETMRKYIAINELSRAIDYKLEISVDKEIEDCSVIHLLLMPFVENAVIHGFDGGQQECKIRIECMREDDFMVIKVLDNGFGITDEQLERLNDPEHYDASYGIKNSYNRLKLVYGEESSIHYESKLNCGTKVTIRFKFKT